MLTKRLKIELCRPLPTSRDKSQLAFDRLLGSTRICRILRNPRFSDY